MKNLPALLVCACLFAGSSGVFSQDASIPLNEPDRNKPKLFAATPASIPVPVSLLQQVVLYETGQVVSLQASPAFHFKGQVISSGSKYQNTIRSVVIRSSNYNGARLSLSRVVHQDGSITYSGRIVSMQHGDLYELVQQEGQYRFEKKLFYDLINE